MELELLHRIQSAASPALDLAAQVLTISGGSVFLLLFICLVYWTVDKEKGETIMLSLLLALLFGNVLKVIFHRPRPIGEPGVRVLYDETATGWSFPSGHTANAAAGCTAFALAFRKRLITVLAVLFIILVGLSRLYIGVHWPSDVLAGIALGVLLAFVTARFSYYVIREKGTAFILTAAALLIAALACGDPDLIRSAGIACGAAAAVPLEHRFVRFGNGSGLWKNILRFLLGAVLVGGLYLGLKYILPDSDFWLFARCFAVGIGALLLCPWLFVKFKL